MLDPEYSFNSGFALFSVSIVVARTYSLIQRKSPVPRTTTWSCTCGNVEAHVCVSTRNIPSAECYCGDCSAFANYMITVKKSPVNVLNDKGGVFMVQLFKDEFAFTKGKSNVRRAKLNEKTFVERLYVSCCNTPLGLVPNLDCYPMLVCYLDNFADKSLFGPAWWRLNCRNVAVKSWKDSAIVDDNMSISFCLFTLGRFLYGLALRRGHPNPLEGTDKSITYVDT